MHRVIRFAVLVLVPGMVINSPGLMAQTTQGLISGSAVNSVTGRPIGGAAISFSSATLAASGTYKSDPAGYFFLPLLSPGLYTVRATVDGYQTQELQELELRVAGRIQIDFKLRPLQDVWEAGQFRSVFLPGSKTIVTFFGPDVDPSKSGSFEGQQGKRGTLDTSASYVIDPQQIGNLPLNGRDVYAMLVSLPGVTANNGTARGLGISVAGQRPSSSNFLLDGVENDNYLVTGPLTAVAPEAVQEYRISTNNYSAEYGRTSGFIANAVTRAGGAAFHGIGYEYLKNDVLDANDFADNLYGIRRRPDKQHQFGYQVGGPIRRDRLFFSSAFEELINHSAQAGQSSFAVPTTNFIPALSLPATNLARQLLEKFPGPVIQSKNITAPYTVVPPVVVNRMLAFERGDYSAKNGRDHIMGRLALVRVSQPDFIWSPYPDFITPLQQNTTGISTNWMHNWTPRLTSELKASYSDDNLWWNRAHPEVPTLATGDGTLLPSSTAAYSYRNHNRSSEIIYSTVWTRNRHVISAGAGMLFRFNTGYLTIGGDGEYVFTGATNFGLGRPNAFLASVDAFSSTLTQPNFNRDYSSSQNYFFAQDSWRVATRFTLNYGLRYERFGAPRNTGAVKDALVQLGTGKDFNSLLASAALKVPGSGNQQIFAPDNKDFAPRVGFSWDPFGKSKTVLRGGFGIFYDRPFDNLWQNVRSNSVSVRSYDTTGVVNYLQPIAAALPAYQKKSFELPLEGLTLMDPRLRNGYAESFFLGLQQSFGDNITLEVTGNRSQGRRLVTDDIVNRQFTTTDGTGRPNELLPNIVWRSSEGKSDYTAVTALLRYTYRALQLQAAYTLSHSIDNQSDPLVGDFFDLNFTTIGSGGSTALTSTFAQQYNGHADRGNSDYDQRQNLFIVGTWQSESRRLLTRNWQLSWMAAFRTGLPYTILTPTTQAPDFGSGVIQNQRADLFNPSQAFLPTPKPAKGGFAVLNAAAFSEPLDASVIGTTGRNAFRGPGLYNIDFSLSRSFSVPRLREGTRFTIRADAFNLLNHANLNNPGNLLGAPDFGIETFGRQGSPSGFPAVSPVNETARQIQILVRFEF